MKDQLRYLQQLQTIDTQIQEIRQSIASVPASLAPAKDDLAKLEAMLAGERSKIEETEAWRSEQEAVVNREQEALKSAKGKLAEAKNARDFSAASREIDNKKRSIHEREQEVLKLYEALEVGRERLAQREADVEKLREHVRSEEAKFDDVLKELEGRAALVAEARPQVVSKLSAQLMARYDNVTKRRGSAVVAVVNGVCQGCHMALAPQQSNLVARGETIEGCRQCNRLLYRPEDFESEEENASEAG